MIMTERATSTQIYRIVIKTSAPALWEAITSPAWSERYGLAAASSTT
jgi:hypothetical protein